MLRVIYFDHLLHDSRKKFQIFNFKSYTGSHGKLDRISGLDPAGNSSFFLTHAAIYFALVLNVLF